MTFINVLQFFFCNLFNILQICIFEHCTGENGGSIYIHSTYETDISFNKFKKATFSIDNCSFIQNIVFRDTKNVYGGSNYFILSNGTIESSTFSNNNAHVYTTSSIYIYIRGVNLF